MNVNGREVPAPVILRVAVCLLRGEIVSDRPSTMTAKFETLAEAVLFQAMAGGVGWCTGDIVHWGASGKYGVMAQEVTIGQEVPPPQAGEAGEEEPLPQTPWFSYRGERTRA